MNPCSKPARRESEHALNIKIGQRLCLNRQLAGRSQTDLAKHLGVSFQQIQKYEAGTNRISFAKAIIAAEYLGVPIGDLLPKDDLSQTLPVDHRKLIADFASLDSSLQKAVRLLLNAMVQSK